MRYVFMALLTTLLSGCGIPGQAPRTPSGFELYVDNGSLPPEYQHATEMSATLAEDGIDAEYSYRDAEQEFNRSAVLGGATFAEATRLLESARMLDRNGENMMVGGEVIRLTMIYPDGTRVEGEPSNAQEWKRWLELVRADIGAPAPKD